MSRRSKPRRREHPEVPPSRAPRPAFTPAPEALARITLGVVVCAAIVRFAASWNDLWLDEIWSLTLIRDLSSPLGVFGVRHDNNHVLHSLALYALMPLDSDWAYRIPAIVAGIATVILAVRLAKLPLGEGRDDASPALRGLVAAVVVGGSYPLVHYGSEARGYALALAFGLAAMVVVVGDGVRPRSRRAPLAWLLLGLAFLSHALAIHILVALAVWGGVRAVRRQGVARGVETTAWWFAVPLVGFVVFYAAFLRGIKVGGGDREGIGPPLLRAVAMTTGLPFDTPAAVLIVVALVVVGGGLAWLAYRRSDEWLLYLVGIVVSPIVLAVAQPTNLYAERYFLVSALLILLLGARAAAWAIAAGAALRLGALVSVAAYLVGAAVGVERLLAVGRGSYRDAIEHAMRRTAGDTVTIGSDHDFRNRLVVEYYGPRLPGGKTVRYVRANETPAAEWYVAHRSAGGAPPPLSVERRGARYALQRQYETAPLSGLRWFLYQRAQ